MKILKNVFTGVAAAALVLGAASPSKAVPVAAEIVLLMDVSGSVSTAEFQGQRDGYANAFKSAAVKNAIESTPNGIAVTLVQWSGPSQQAMFVGWTHLVTAAHSQSLGESIALMTRFYNGSTALGDALAYGRTLFGTETGFASNGIESQRQVIDVSGDGATNAGTLTSLQGRNLALAAGVDVINGIAILGEANLADHYLNNVIGGTNADNSPAFLLQVANFTDQFEAAIIRKLVAETTGTGIPEPGMIFLLGLGLAGIGLTRRYPRTA